MVTDDDRMYIKLHCMMQAKDICVAAVANTIHQQSIYSFTRSNPDALGHSVSSSVKWE